MDTNGNEVRYTIEPETTTERVAYAVFQILSGATMTTAELAEAMNMTWAGADEMLNRASRVVPIAKVETRWQKFDNK